MYINRIFKRPITECFAKHSTSSLEVPKLPQPVKDEFSKTATDSLSHSQKPYPTDAKALYPSAKKKSKRFNRKEFLAKLKAMKNQYGYQKFGTSWLKKIKSFTNKELQQIEWALKQKYSDGNDKFCDEYCLNRIGEFTTREMKQLKWASKQKNPDGTDTFCGLDCVEIGDCAKAEFIKFKYLLNDKSLTHLDMNALLILAKAKETNLIIDVMKQYKGELSPLGIIGTLLDASSEQIEFLKPCFTDMNLTIHKEEPDGLFTLFHKDGSKIRIDLRKETQSYTMRFKINGNIKQRRLIKTNDGIYFQEIENPKVQGFFPDLKPESNIRFYSKIQKIEPELEIYDYAHIVEFLRRPNITGKTVFTAPHSLQHGHAQFNLPQGANRINEINGTTISQLDVTAHNNTNAERITYHYPNGKRNINDWGIGLHSTLEPIENGMRVRKIVGKKEIRLSSQITDTNIKITNDTTGKSIKYPLKNMIKSDNGIFREMGFFDCINDDLRTQKVIELFKQLSPITLLELIQFKKAYRGMQLPYITESFWSKYCSPGDNPQKVMIASLTLSDSPESVAHETRHVITNYINLLENKKIQMLHKKEIKKAGGLVRYISQYAIDGQKGDAVCGLNELISIMGTYNEYGIESVERAEAIRLAFPETTKAIEEALMRNTKQIMKAFGLE